MWIMSHRYLAKKIHYYIKEKYGLDLRLDLLQYGSIKPDVHWHYIKISHYYDEGYVYCLEEIGQLLKDSKYQDIKKFSQKLGIVLHFIADFHTFAHNEKDLQKNMSKHLLYEFKLHQALLHYDFRVDDYHICCGSVHSLMKRLVQEYIKAEPSLENDMRFIYTATLSITDLMVEAVLLPSVQAA